MKLRALLTMLVLFQTALAHVPLNADGNENISNAMQIYDPEKSWAVYGFLNPQTAHYCSLDLEAGQRIYLSLLKSTNPEEANFQPGFALIGPGLQTEGRLPDHVHLPPAPEGYGILAVSGRIPEQAIYEPFGPSSYYELAELDLPAPESARYHVAVYDSRSSPGHYALGVGEREEFGFAERMTMPLRLISVYLWEGQSLALILIPYLTAVLIAVLLFMKGSRRTAFRLAGTLAALLFLATSAQVLSQMTFNLIRAPFGPEAYITLALAAIPALLGVAALRLSNGEAGLLQRMGLAMIGTVALLAGAGLIIGPLLAMAASMLPSRRGLPPLEITAKGNS